MHVKNLLVASAFLLILAPDPSFADKVKISAATVSKYCGQEKECIVTCGTHLCFLACTSDGCFGMVVARAPGGTYDRNSTLGLSYPPASLSPLISGGNGMQSGPQNGLHTSSGANGGTQTRGRP